MLTTASRKLSIALASSAGLLAATTALAPLEMPMIFGGGQVHCQKQADASDGGVDADRIGRQVCEWVRTRQSDTSRLRQLLGDIATGKDASSSPVQLRHPLGWSPLHLAACDTKDGARMVRELLTVVPTLDVNLAERTPPSGATARQSSQQRLSNRQAWEEWVRGRQEEFHRSIDPTAITTGFTPLHYAVLMGNVEVIDLLFEHGADPQSKTAQGYLPRDFYEPQKQDHRVGEALERGTSQYQKRKEQRERELRRRYPLEQKLKERIVGQEPVITSVASAIRRKMNGWHDEDKPLVFLFLGSSGIGKTALAKQLAEYVHRDDREGLIRIDLSEYQSKHEVSKLLGSPPGYIGYDQGGQLTEKLKKRPNAVVLLDEVEKAHVDVLTVMLQVFDEGRLTDGKGETVDCRDAIFIMTSNLGQLEIAEHADHLRKEAERKAGNAPSKELPDADRTDDLKPLEPTAAAATPATPSASAQQYFQSHRRQFLDHLIYPILRAHFRRDEFLGRINETLVFLPFSPQELSKITEMELRYWSERAHLRHNISLTWSDDVVEYLRNGYNVHYGARSIKHEVEKKVVNVIAKAYENDELRGGDAVHLCLLGGQLNVRIQHPQNNVDGGGNSPSSSGFSRFWK